MSENIIEEDRGYIPQLEMVMALGAVVVKPQTNPNPRPKPVQGTSKPTGR